MLVEIVCEQNCVHIVLDKFVKVIVNSGVCNLGELVLYPNGCAGTAVSNSDYFAAGSENAFNECVTSAETENTDFNCHDKNSFEMNLNLF